MRFGPAHVLTVVLAAVLIFGVPQLLISQATGGAKVTPNFQPPPPPGSGSPLKVKGGSIYAELQDTSLTWSDSCGTSAEYCTTLPGSLNSYRLEFNGFDNSCSAPSITAKEGWTIVILNPDRPPKPSASFGTVNGLTLCNNSACEPSKPSDGNGQIFIESPVEGKSRLHLSSKRVYHHYFKKTRGCNSLNSSGDFAGPCDKMAGVILETSDAQHPKTTCKCSSFSCEIDVGGTP